MTVWRPTDATPLTPLRVPFGLLADSVDAEIATKGFNQYATKALMDAVTGNPGQHATVYADSTPANNGDYISNGSVWVKVLVDTDWIALPFAANWSSYDPTTWGAVSYRRRGTKVALRGAPLPGAGAGTTIGTLPATFRPQFDEERFAWMSTTVAKILIQRSGAVVVAGTLSGTAITLGELEFSVA